MPTYIDGIGTSENIDSSGEVISLQGLDISSLEVDGVFNWEHKADLPGQIVGKILKAKKIFSEKDAEDDRQLFYWDKFKTPYLYVMGELFDDYNESAKEVAGFFQYDADKGNDDKNNVLGFSIEGMKGNKEGMVIKKSIARKVTLTNTPCNKAAIARSMKSKEDSRKDDVEDFFKTELNTNVGLLKVENMTSLKKDAPKMPAAPQGAASGGGIALKAPVAPAAPKAGLKQPDMSSNKQIGMTTTNKPVMSHQKVHEYGFNSGEHKEAGEMHRQAAIGGKTAQDKSHHFDKMRLHNEAAATAEHHESRFANALASKRKQAIESARKVRKDEPKNKKSELAKALSAGSGMAAPSALVGGAALGKENLSGKIHKSKWLKRAESEYKTWEKKEQFEKFMSERMPHITKNEIVAIGQALALKKSLKAEKAIAKLSKEYVETKKK